MEKSIKMIIALIIFLLAGVGITVMVSNNRNNTEKITIIATNFPAYDFARAVAGETAEIKMLINPGVEMHDFEPTPGDIIDIKNSELFIYTGGESDEWIEDILGDINANKTRLFRMMDAVKIVEEEAIEGMEDAEESGETEYDEHIWTSLRNAEKIVDRIKDELIEISPENKSVFEENAKNYTEKLAELDSEFQEIVANGKRDVIVFGDRFPFRYFVDDYGLDYFAAFPGCSEQTEASNKTIAFLVDKIKTEKIPVVFKVEMSSGKIAETIANETGAEILTFNSAHNISAEDFKSGLTYAKIMKNNTEVLQKALEQ
ncbi:MAG: metal ABC transporter substrate-binding protein [Candidatus Saccharibacteria bacterium]|nr:metal ABC transporter substrate-binding protein [Candidatus Saccharibacteria bacterium]